MKIVPLSHLRPMQITFCYDAKPVSSVQLTNLVSFLSFIYLTVSKHCYIVLKNQLFKKLKVATFGKKLTRYGLNICIFWHNLDHNKQPKRHEHLSLSNQDSWNILLGLSICIMLSMVLQQQLLDKLRMCLAYPKLRVSRNAKYCTTHSNTAAHRKTIFLICQILYWISNNVLDILYTQCGENNLESYARCGSASSSQASDKINILTTPCLW